MKAADIDLSAWLDFRPEVGKLLLNDRRMLVFSQAALGTLDELVVTHLGHEFAAAIFTQFGYRCGSEDYRNVAAEGQWDSDEDRISSGPVMHMWEGLVHVTPTTLAFDRTAGTFVMAGQWRNSYEAENHLQRYGPSTRPVCWALTGYASGWASEFFGAQLLAVETSCAAQGDDFCEFEIRPWDAWGHEADAWRRALTDTPESVTSHMEAIVVARTDELSESNRRLAAARDSIEQANAVKSAYLTNLGHELRAPLDSVLGLAEVLRSSGLDPDQERIVDLILGAGMEQVGIVSDLLDYTSVEADRQPAQWEQTDLTDLLHGIVASFAGWADAKSVQLSSTISAGLPARIRTDPTRLRQILSALVNNAVKFTAPGGRVEVSAQRRGEGIALSVSDDGIGIAAEVQPHVFEPAPRGEMSVPGRFGGKGLGLSLSRRLVDLLGATIEVDSTHGQGSTFTVVVPTSPAEPQTPVPSQGGAAPRPVPIPAEPLRILVADDNRINAIVLTKLLEALDCDVATVVDGAAAIAAFDTDDFDVVVLALHMPETSGLDVVRHIRQAEAADGSRPRLVAALTSDVLASTRQQCLQAGFTEVLTAPMRKDAVAGLVGRAAGLKRLRQH